MKTTEKLASDFIGSLYIKFLRLGLFRLRSSILGGEVSRWIKFWNWWHKKFRKDVILQIGYEYHPDKIGRGKWKRINSFIKLFVVFEIRTNCHQWSLSILKCLCKMCLFPHFCKELNMDGLVSKEMEAEICLQLPEKFRAERPTPKRYISVLSWKGLILVCTFKHNVFITLINMGK
jgi:hypothetical protein